MLNPAGVWHSLLSPIPLLVGLLLLTAAPGTELRPQLCSQTPQTRGSTLAVCSRSCFEEGGEESPGQCGDATLAVWLLPRPCTAWLHPKAEQELVLLVVPSPGEQPGLGSWLLFPFSRIF